MYQEKTNDPPSHRQAANTPPIVTHRQRVICDADPGAEAGPADFVAALTLFRARGASDRPR